MKIITAALFLTSLAAFGQTSELTQDASPQHRFFDRPARFSLSASAGVYAADTAITCHYIGQGQFHEAFLPVKSCPGIAVWMGSMFAAQSGTAYWLHRTGHHRLERFAETLWASGSVIGITYTLKHRPREADTTMDFVRGDHVRGVCIVGQTC